MACDPAAQAQAVTQKSDAPQAKPAAGLGDPFEVKTSGNWRGKPLYEILFMNRDAKGPGGIGNYYNSL